MRLKTIKLAGFKSFVDPTSVSFPSNMAAVVGPNGCGKSNIIDAVRWVMGESSAKTLRGESMTDVIFNGTTHRKPVGQASIELIFDNSDGGSGGEYAAYAEISVRRMVSRDGGSDYFLNGTKCRRRDITDLFLGTGLGPRSYAIIEQGMISRLIESRPEDLRVFIEEAAGISKYKERRKETESRMRRTVENLERLTDLREELERQLSHLQRQAQSAEKYKEFKAEERLLTSELFALQWLDLKRDLDKAANEKSEFEVELAAANAEQERFNLDIERLRLAHHDATEHLNAVQAEFYSIGGEVTRVEQAIKYEKEKRDGAQRDLQQVTSALAQQREHLDSDQSRLTQWEGELADHEPQQAVLKAQLKAAQEQQAEAEEAMASWQSNWDLFTQRTAGPRQTAEVEQSRIVYLEQVLRRLRERIEKLRGESDSLAEGVDVTYLDELDMRIEAAAEQVLTREQTAEELQSHIETLREQIKALRVQQDSMRTELQQLRGQRSSLDALQDAALAEQENQRVTDWLSAQGRDIDAVLLDQLTVESGWEASVEQVLAHALAAYTAKDLAALLQQARGVVPSGLYLVDPAPGVAQRDNTLASKVAGPAVVMTWLSTVLIAQSPEQAGSMLASLQDNESVITPCGIWAGRGWLRSRTAADATTGIIERKAALAQIEVALQAQIALLEEVEYQLEGTEREHVAAEAGLTQAQNSLKQAVREHAELMAEKKSQLGALEQMEARRQRAVADLAEAQAQFSQEEKSLTEARGLLANALDQMEADEGEQATRQAERDVIRTRLQELREKARDTRDALHRIDMLVQNLRTQIGTTRNGIARTQQQLDQLVEREAQLRELAAADDNPDELLQEQLFELLEQKGRAEEALSSARQVVSDKETTLRQLDQQRLVAGQRAQTVQQKIDQLRIAQAERSVRMETLDKRLAELDQKPMAVVDNLPEGANETEWQLKVERIGQKITRLGPINLAAIDECARASERKDYLDAQNADLVAALDMLESAIRKIDKETRARFQDTFERVNAGFSELFPKVFGGGTACLELTGDDLLDTGVSIMARPPGKKNSTIHLLSGGEKAMTAIALVFSIFQLNPAPFCMLDEVDAPLDDANVGRYARMVKEMSEKVQFIFITHNKITMEVADQLMGVTMHEPGVSRLVTVDVEEAAQLAAS
jgi:chromosome segregation protein